MDVKKYLNIDLSQYFSLPENERREIAEGISYNDSFRHDVAVDFFFSFVYEHDKSEDIRKIALKRSCYANDSVVKMADND